MEDVFLDDYELKGSTYECLLSNSKTVTASKTAIDKLIKANNLTEIDAIEMYLWDKELLHDSETENTPKIKVRGDSAKPRKKAVRERKVDNEKLEILQALAETLTSLGYEPTIEKEVNIHFDNYSIKLTRHRNK